MDLLTASGASALAAAALVHTFNARPDAREATRLASARVLARLADARSLDLDDGDTGGGPLVAISGATFCAAPLSGAVAETPPAVLIATTDTLVSPSPALPAGTRTVLREATQWGLDDGSGTRIPVTGVRRATGLPMASRAHVELPDDRPGHRRALDVLFGVRTLGRVTTERALPVGARVTAVGVLKRVPAGAAPRLPGGVACPDGRVLALTPPPTGAYWVTDATPAGLVAAAAAAAARSAAAAHSLAAIGGSLLAARALAAALRALRRRRAAKRLARARAARDEAVAAAGVEGGGGSACVVCYSAPVDAAYPCGHAVTCWACAVAAKSCPMCRAKGRVIRLFFP